MRQRVNNAMVNQLTFRNRENSIRHHYYDEDMEKYECLKAGDPAGIQQCADAFGMKNMLEGKLSENPVKNAQYLFIAAVTLACRFAMEGGMNSEIAYNASDLYIRQLDSLVSLEQVRDLAIEMFTYYTDYMAQLKKRDVFSLPVLRCEDYIDQHLHDDITLPALASYVGLNPHYLSRLFKKETGTSITDYIIEQRIYAAKNLLKYSDYSIAAISNYLNFSTQSYFNRVFKNVTGETPNSYRKKNFRTSFNSD